MPKQDTEILLDDPCRASAWRVGTARLAGTIRYGAIVGLFAGQTRERKLGVAWLLPEEAREMALLLLAAADKATARTVPLPLDAEEKEGA